MDRKVYHQIISKNHDFNIYYFDLFDTILHRKYSPNYPFYLLAYYLIQNYRLNIKQPLLVNSLKTFFSDCSIESDKIITNIYLHYKINSLEEYDSFKAKVTSCMLEAEINNCFISSNIPELFNYLIANKKDIIIVTDYYFESSFLKKLLNNFPEINHYNKIISSCEEGKTKADCSLFSLLAKRKAFYITDNYESDFINAKKSGLETVIVDSSNHYKKYKHFDNCNYKNTIRLLQKTKEKKSEYYTSNYIFVIYQFLDKLYKELDYNDTVFFCAREGWFLKNLFDIYLKKYNYKNIKTKYLMVSRLSMFLMSKQLLSCPFKELSGLLKTYTEWDVKYFRQILLFLGFYDGEIDELFASYSFEDKGEELFSNEQAAHIWDTKELKEAIKDNKNIAIKRLTSKFENLLTINIVDIGWRGTLQNSLRDILPENKRINGYYIGLTNCIGEKINSYKKGLIFDYLDDDYLYKNGIHWSFENLLRANHGIVACHRKDDELLIDDVAVSIYEDYSKERQEIMLLMFSKLLEYNAIFPIDNSLLTDFNKSLIRKIPKEVRYYDGQYNFLQSSNSQFTIQKYSRFRNANKVAKYYLTHPVKLVKRLLSWKG